MPAIDTGRSVSRVGGDAQLPAYKSLVGPLKLFYSQFEELESFTKFGTQLDKDTLMRINRGKAIRVVLEQIQYNTMSAPEQIAVFMATNAGLLDGLSTENNKKAQTLICDILKSQFDGYVQDILNRKKLTKEQQDEMIKAFQFALNNKGLVTDDH
jgi:F-type H+-transporting ATPase subunit alpha